jgi:hypothetical protein
LDRKRKARAKRFWKSHSEIFQRKQLRAERESNGKQIKDGFLKISSKILSAAFATTFKESTKEFDDIEKQSMRHDSTNRLKSRKRNYPPTNDGNAIQSMPANAPR